MGRMLAVLAAGLILVTSGCTQGDEKSPSMTRYTLQHDGLEREYFVFLPSSYDGDKTFPAAVFLHGFGGTATGTEAEVTQGLNRYAENAGYVVIYPQGTWFMAGAGTDQQFESTSWNHISDGFDKGPEGPICTEDASQYECPPECGDCGECGWASCNDDVGFLKALVAATLKNLAIDEHRMYVGGFSNGAMMAQRVACEASDLFAAAFLAHGRVEPGFECTPTSPMPMLQVNGTNDRAVPIDGNASSGGYFYSTPEIVAEHWLDGASCATDVADWDSSYVEHEAVRCAAHCADTSHPVIDCRWQDGNHRWPGTPGVLGSDGYCVSELQAASMPQQTICLTPDPNVDIWGSALMFDFFSTRFE